MAIQDMFDIFDEPSSDEEAAHQARKRATAAAIYQDMVNQVKGQSFLGQVATAAKNEVGNLARGTGEFANTTAGVIKGILGMDNQDNIDHGIELAKREAQLNEGERAFNENANLGARIIGGSLPYMVDSVALGPKFVKGAAKGLDVLDAGIRTTARKGGEAGKTIIEQMAESGVTPIASAGKYLQKEVVEPVIKYANRFKNRIPESDPFLKGWAPRIIGDTALGAVEGGLHADNSMQEGAIASGIGSTIGQAIKPAFHRMPSYYNKTENELIQWGKDKGMQFLPGMETGHRGMQMFENDLRGSSAWTDTINQIDRNNNYIGNRIAFEQLLPEADREAIKKLPGKSSLRVKEMNPEVLNEHMGKLSAEYDDFVKSSVVRLEKPEIDLLKQSINPLSTSKVESNQNVFKIVSTHLDDLEKLRSSQLPIRDPLTGRMRKGPVMNSGEEYQKLRSAIKNDLNQAHSVGNTLLVEKLTPLLRTLDSGLERGAEEMGGKTRVAQWKDLNERWALSNLIMEEGMTPNGMVDLDKLGKHFMSSEPKRYLMETAGPRMKELYKATKLSNMVKNQASGGLFDEAGEFLHNPQKMSTAQRLVGTTPAAFVPGLRSAYMNMYKLGYPSQWGLLGLTGNGPFDIQKVSRSVQQSSQMYPSIFETIGNGIDTLENLPEKIRNRINNATGKPKRIRGEYDDLFE